MTHVTKGKLFHAGCVAFVVFTVSGVLAAAAMCIVLTMWQQQQPAILAAYNTVKPGQQYYGVNLVINDQNLAWNNDLYQPSSLVFKQYNDIICNGMTTAMQYSDSLGGPYIGCAVGIFRPGSVEVTLRLTFATNDFTMNAQNSINAIKDAITKAVNNGYLNFALNPSKFVQYVWTTDINNPCLETTCQQVCTVTGDAAINTNTTTPTSPTTCSCYLNYTLATGNNPTACH